MHMRLIVRPALVGVLALSAVLALAACGPTSSAISRSTASPEVSPRPSLSPGWRLHSDIAAGYAMGLPDAWVLAIRDAPTLDGDLAVISNGQADLGRYFQSSFSEAPQTGLALLAVDPASVGKGFVTNVAVFFTDLGPAGKAPTLDAVAAGKTAVLVKDSTIVGTVDRRHPVLDGHPAERWAYVFRSGSNSVEVVSYLVLTDAGGRRFEYEVTMGSLLSDYATLFAQLSASFQLLSGGPGSANASPKVSPSAASIPPQYQTSPAPSG